MTESGDLRQARDRMLEYLELELVGPRGGPDEVLNEEPHRRYMSGVLYPQRTVTDSVAGGEEQDTGGVAGGAGQHGGPDENQGDDPIALANEYLPGSMGISFCIRGRPEVFVRVTCGVYAEQHLKAGHRRSWKRTPVSVGPILLAPPAPEERRVQPDKRSVLDGAARVHSIWRPNDTGWLVTVTLINEKKAPEKGLPPADDCLCQASFSCRVSDDTRIISYPRPPLLTDDPEEQILELLYREVLSFGAGHGCSISWEPPVDGVVREVHTRLIPDCEVHPLTYDVDIPAEVLSPKHLADLATVDPGALAGELLTFVDSYACWVSGLETRAASLPARFAEPAKRALERLRHAENRMRRGTGLLLADDTVREAFALANRAMLMQRVHGGDALGGKRKPLGTAKHTADLPADAMTWRPFQLAFLLLELCSVADPLDPDREVVDLIWFPTGGGKTEAYLAVAAFHIFHRRLVHGAAGAGTTVMMRYTLRLLTAQQFCRAATLICACELLRRESPQTLGDEEVGIGLWVGGGATPNRCNEAVKKYLDILASDPPTGSFQIDWCPWCGTEIIPRQKSADPTHYGIRSDPASFELYCPDSKCPFHARLPVQVVDDELYRHPPTLLLATVDKFARLPWEDRAGSFFGGGGVRPPELIIQDELHLISGPLGTIVGVYEIAVDALASWQGTPPKILASTATIRRADQQCRGLYARSVELFPPNGLDASDSYFARVDTASPGRLYVGVMGQGHTGSTSMIRTTAALLQAPIDVPLPPESLDGYWTLVAYHNSLRELGRTLNFSADDIPARIKDVVAVDQAHVRPLDDDNVVELTSNIDAARLAGILERLKLRHDEDGSVSLLVCTNMLSVGVDVQRLALMLVNGQPKSTSEYIQATSRVGRGRVPGLIVALYSPTKPRDRSHYEQFHTYHLALYRHVEPTGVTPFALPARNRALHAVLVTLIRHALGLASDSEAGNFIDSLPGLDRVVGVIRERAARVDSREEPSTIGQLEALIRQWQSWSEKEGALYYSGGRQYSVVLRQVGEDRPDGWETLNSMRNVDRDCLIDVMKGA